MEGIKLTNGSINEEVMMKVKEGRTTLPAITKSANRLGHFLRRICVQQTIIEEQTIRKKAKKEKIWDDNRLKKRTVLQYFKRSGSGETNLEKTASTNPVYEQINYYDSNTSVIARVRLSLG